MYMDYELNKGIGESAEFKGLKSQYLFIFAGGNENLNKEDFEEGVLYRYTIKLVQSSGK